MELPTSVMAGVAAACKMPCGSAAQAQSAITNVYPNGTNMFQPNRGKATLPAFGDSAADHAMAWY